MTPEAFVGEGAVQRFRRAQSPRPLWAEDGRTGRPFGDLQALEFPIASATRLPLDPDDATQAPSDPAVQRLQLAPLAEAEVSGPSPHKWVQVGDHLLQADAPMPPCQFADPVFEPGHAPSRRCGAAALGSSLTVKPRNDRCHGRATALFSVLICSLRRRSMKRVRLAMTRRPAFSLRT